MNVYQEIKERLKLWDIVRFYGVSVNRNNMANCPFHEDDKPSMKIYDKGFCCYGCQEKGDTLKFVQKLFNLSLPEAAARINQDFSLGLDTGKTFVTIDEYKDRKLLQAEHAAFEAKFNEVSIAFASYFRYLNEWRRTYAPRNPGDNLHMLFVESLQKTEIVSFICDCFINMDEKDRKIIMDDYASFIAEVRIRVKELNQKAHHKKSVLSELKHSNMKESLADGIKATEQLL